jgi:PAS domain S-box-containing protein
VDVDADANGTVTPVTDRRMAALLESVSDAFLALDADWCVTYANREAARLSDTTPEALLGRSHWDVWPWTVGSEVERQYRLAVGENQAVHFEHYYADSNVWHSIHAYPAEGGGLAIFYRDVTEAKRLERERELLLREAEMARAEAERANGAKSQFLTMMSHELRTPLNAIAGYVQLLDMELYGTVTSEQRDALRRIERAQAHLLGLINDVLSYARLESGRMDYELRVVDLHDVLADVEPLITPQLAARDIAYAERLPSAALAVWADRDKLVQILLNLLSNAAKFTAPGGRVTVETATRADGTQPPQTVFIRVTDTGVGIPAAKLERIFEPFVQVDASHSRIGQGAGLGLAISRDMARGMGGDLRARSRVGEFTSLTLALQRGDQPRPQVEREHGETVPGATR